jgi:hypothetical protein
MNYWNDEKTAEYNRQRIIDDVQQISLEKIALRARVYRPGLFERTMFNFANWMILTGKQLRNRYEVPAVNCNKSPTGNFAH